MIILWILLLFMAVVIIMLLCGYYFKHSHTIGDSLICCAGITTAILLGHLALRGIFG